MGVDSSFLLLREGKTDSCFNETSLKAAAECLQTLLEVYYGRSFTRTCPTLPLILADAKCRGCPWDGLNATAANSVSIAADAVNRSELFHHVPDSCRIAQHARLYALSGGVASRIYFFGFFGPILSLVSSAVLASSQRPKIIPYPALVFLSWFMYTIGHILLSIFEDYFLICETMVSSMAYDVTRVISYVGLLYSSVRMCYRLQTGHDDYQKRSWESYLKNNMPIRKHRLIANLVCKGGPTLMFLVFLFDYIYAPGNGIVYSECSIGSRDIRYGLFQYSKLLLEWAAVTLYSFGPPRKSIWFYIRYILFFFLLISSIMGIIAFSCVRELRATFSYSMTIGRVLDARIAFTLVEFGHVISVACYGLLEPLRVGWPDHPKPYVWT